MFVNETQARDIAVEVMSQEIKPIVFENEQLKEELRKLREGESVVLPKNVEHARFMLMVAQQYINTLHNDLIDIIKNSDR